MGKPTGFLEYARLERRSLSPGEWLGNYLEFHADLSKEQRREQGGRCMNCGVPFCQSEYGCPLHNLIPEWNDEVYSGNTKHALSRLLKTNSFPEFTGRVCPALCENACVCSLHGEAVTVRDNELAIIEDAWEKGWMTPVPPAVRTGKRVAVVGSGPAGLSVAEALNRDFVSVKVDREERPDADSDGVEGRFYVFTRGELERLLGKDATAFCDRFGVTETVNFQHGNSILNLIGAPDWERPGALEAGPLHVGLPHPGDRREVLSLSGRCLPCAGDNAGRGPGSSEKQECVLRRTPAARIVKRKSSGFRGKTGAFPYPFIPGTFGT